MYKQLAKIESALERVRDLFDQEPAGRRDTDAIYARPGI
jgi:hypothetical protein